MSKIKIHSILSESKVNGPGSRIVIWTQGCSKGCQGCFNPETWTQEAGIDFSVYELYMLIKDLLSHNTGITITGGDPLEQPEPLFYLLKIINDNLLSQLPDGIILFTGYTMDEIDNHEDKLLSHIIPLVDLTIDGRFVSELKNDHFLSGSSNQKFHFNCINNRGEQRIPRHTIEIDHSVEIHEGPQDLIQITGFPNVDRKFFKDKGLDIV
jgi:anaerobic ribonucleoside-triphosphate reductase activating protein